MIENSGIMATIHSSGSFTDLNDVENLKYVVFIVFLLKNKTNRQSHNRKFPSCT